MIHCCTHRSVHPSPILSKVSSCSKWKLTQKMHSWTPCREQEHSVLMDVFIKPLLSKLEDTCQRGGRKIMSQKWRLVLRKECPQEAKELIYILIHRGCDNTHTQDLYRFKSDKTLSPRGGGKLLTPNQEAICN